MGSNFRQNPKPAGLAPCFGLMGRLPTACGPTDASRSVTVILPDHGPGTPHTSLVTFDAVSFAESRRAVQRARITL